MSPARRAAAVAALVLGGVVGVWRLASLLDDGEHPVAPIDLDAGTPGSDPDPTSTTTSSSPATTTTATTAVPTTTSAPPPPTAPP
ncbi:MAG TPA: hypothetical protein VF228_17500, partial [Iamia sp.]